MSRKRPENEKLPTNIRRAPNGRRGFQVRYYDDAGKRRTKTYARLADARAFLKNVQADVQHDEWIAPELGRVKFDAYADEWLTTKNVRASTLGNVHGRLRKHAKPYFGAMELAAVKPTHIRAFIADLVSQKYAPSTIKAIVLTTGQIFDQAVEDGYILRSPFTKKVIEGLPADVNSEEQHFLSAQHVNELAHAISERYRAAVYLAAYGGLRAGELWALRPERVDTSSRTVEVLEAASEAGGFHVGPTKTGKKRTIVVPQFLADILAEHLDTYPGPYVFTSSEGGPVMHTNFRRRNFRKACIAAGLGAMVKADGDERAHYEGVRFHDLRHTCAALLIATGRHMEEVKNHLGHSSIRVTSDRYGHIFPNARVELADALDETFNAAR